MKFVLVPELDDKDFEKEPPTYDEAFPPLAGSTIGGMAGSLFLKCLLKVNLKSRDMIIYPI